MGWVGIVVCFVALRGDFVLMQVRRRGGGSARR